MAHFAKLDENNVVVDILVVDNSDINNLTFPESEAVGAAYLNSFLPPAVYVQTSYNNSFRVRYAGIGMIFTPSTVSYPDGYFCGPKPFDYFVWDDAICGWVPPVPYPNDGHSYVWDDPAYSWIPMGNKPAPITIIGE